MAVTIVDQGVIAAERIEPGSINTPKGTWPTTTAPNTDENPDQIAENIIGKLNNAFVAKDYDKISKMFFEDGFWRDHLANTWDLRTIKGSGNINKFLSQNCSVEKIDILRGNSFQAPHFGPLDLIGDPQGLSFVVSFRTKIGAGKGFVRAAIDGGDWKILTFFLTLEEIFEFEEPLGPNRVQGVQHGGDPNRKNWQERRAADLDFRQKEPTVLIIGSGQAGLTASARLRMLNVDTLVIDSNKRVGDNWRKRYHQLVLHDPVWYDHMPYMSFPKHWPVFTPKDKLGEWFESYAKLLELNIWTSTELLSSKWDDTEAKWTVEVEREKEDGSKEKRTFHPRHIIQATGHSGKKNFPTMKGMEKFKGDRLCHSSEFSGAKPDGKGKKAVIVGACNSGHDIAQDFYEKGYDVTMVQRSSTTVVSSRGITNIALAGLYDETAPPVEDADLCLWGFPTELFKAQQVLVANMQRENDKATLEGLEKAGFKLDQGPSDAGLFVKYYQRGGGYYIDVGASQLIVDGKIKVKQGSGISEIQEHGLLFEDGTKLAADEIVFATGYQNMRTQARLIFGDDLADRVTNVWGFDEEGEFRTLYRRSGHPGFWFFGGNLAICRYFSRILALQIKAVEEGLARRETEGKNDPVVKRT